MDSPVVPSANALRRDIPLALHYQLKMLIKAKIENGEWPPGAKILSEKDLADQHGVSRLTARQAVQELVRDGWLYRESGRGTFVADYRIQQRLSRLTSFTEDLLERNMIPGARVVSTRLTGPTEAVGSTLQLARDGLLFEIVRVRLANKSPIAYEKIYIPQSLAPDIAAQDLTSSITSLLESRYGLKCPYAEQRIRADVCSAEEAGFLEIKPNSVVLEMERTYFREQGEPAYLAVSVYRADKYEIILTLRR